MKKRVLCYGDSNTFGYVPAGNGRRYAANVRWPGILQAKLKDTHEIIEEGCSGRTVYGDSPGEPWKNGMAYLRCSLHTHKPIDTVILMLGTNDLKNIFRKQAEDIAGGLAEMVSDIQEFMTLKQGFVPDIILTAPPFLNDDVAEGCFGNEFDEESVRQSRRLPALVREAADTHGCIFLDASLFAEVSAKDGIHLSPAGHASLADHLYTILIQDTSPARSEAFFVE